MKHCMHLRASATIVRYSSDKCPALPKALLLWALLSGHHSDSKAFTRIEHDYADMLSSPGVVCAVIQKDWRAPHTVSVPVEQLLCYSLTCRGDPDERGSVRVDSSVYDLDVAASDVDAVGC